MAPRLIGTVLIVFLAVAPVPAQDNAAALTRNIDSLSAFDYATRVNAARMVRRIPAAEAIPALSRAVRTHADQFVRYRALVLLTSFNDPGTGAIMRGLLGDRNDRIREVAYRWFERHPEPALHETLLADSTFAHGAAQASRDTANGQSPLPLYIRAARVRASAGPGRSTGQ